MTGGSGVDTCSLPVNSVGFNISDDDSCDFTQSTDLVNTNPNLGPLANNGGFTPTFLPNPGSPVLDTGGDCQAEDQRGLPRPADGNDDGATRCDRGSVEVQPPAPPPVITPTFTG